MYEELLPWILTPVSGIIVALISYFLGSRKAKNDMKLERRTEIFEDMLRTISNLVDKNILEKGMKDLMVKIKKFGISTMLEDIEEDGILIMDEMKGELQSTGMNEKQIDEFLKKYLLSLYTVIGANIGFGLIDDQIQLNEELMAIGMYVSTKMKKKKSYNKLRETAEEFNEYLDKFKNNKIKVEELQNKAAELSSCINEIMKFR